MDAIIKVLTNALSQLPAAIVVVVIILIVGVIYLWRENGRLREERNSVVKSKDDDLKALAASKDQDIKDMTTKVIELQEKTIESSNELANNIAANTEATKRVETVIANFNTVLLSTKIRK